MERASLLTDDVEQLITAALAEDLGFGDLTVEATVVAGTRARAVIVQKSEGILFGSEVGEAVIRRLDPELEWKRLRDEGTWLDAAPAEVAVLTGDAGALLSGERTALNFMQHLSGIATATARAVEALEGTEVRLLDTRKTTPGLRVLEKQAVAAGGGENHRMGLHDAILVKENHAALAGGVAEATRRALLNRPPGISVEVECATLDDVEQALAAGADRLLLDNMAVPELKRAVALSGGRAQLEASGGITLESIRDVAGTGVQFISIGSLTHSAPVVDVSLRIESA